MNLLAFRILFLQFERSSLSSWLHAQWKCHSPFCLACWPLFLNHYFFCFILCFICVPPPLAYLTMFMAYSWLWAQRSFWHVLMHRSTQVWLYTRFQCYTISLSLNSLVFGGTGKTLATSVSIQCLLLTLLINNSWWGSRDHMKYQGLNSGQPCARQESYLL